MVLGVRYATLVWFIFYIFILNSRKQMATQRRFSACGFKF